jgi:hypothetical protein
VLVKKVLDFNVGWFLRDPEVWGRLARMFTWTIKDAAGKKTIRRMKIPWLVDSRSDQWLKARPESRRPAYYQAVLNANADQWRRIFECTYRKFAPALHDVGLRDVDGRWTSFGMSYEALIRCSLKGKHENFAYVYTACVNAHRAFLKKPKGRPRFTPLDHVDEPISPEATDIDLRIDLDEAIGKLDPSDALICRGYLVEGRTFREIGQILGIHEASVKRRFDAVIPVIRSRLWDYDTGVQMATPREAPQSLLIAA